MCSIRYLAYNALAPYCNLWPAQLYYIFPHYLINGKIFGKKKYWLRYVCFEFLYIFCETFLIIRGTESDMIKNIYRSSCEVPLILVRFLMQCEFPRQNFRKILEYQISRISVQWQPSDSIRTDTRTDMAKLIAALRNFANAPKNISTWS